VCASESASSPDRTEEGGGVISVDTLKWRLQREPGLRIPLVKWPGAARLVAADETRLALLVAGRRADYTWDRVVLTARRLRDNHELSVDELGGRHDAVGLVSLMSLVFAGDLDVDRDLGVLRLRDASGPPVHQHTAATPRDDS
jgi:hypothetical protein